MSQNNSVEQHLHRISLLKQEITEIQEKLQEIESYVQLTVSNLIDRNLELESLAHFDSDSGKAICNWVD